jgi:hypothetical protein
MDPEPAVERQTGSTGASSALVGIEPDHVFAILTDLDRLPTWNEKMLRVVELPDRVEPGAEWVVEFAMFGRKWKSRSRVSDLDVVGRRFEYRTHTDDGNPSFADWHWTVEAAAEGCRVSVSWELHPLTFWRRVVFLRVRARQLAHHEVPASLAALTRVGVTNGQTSG